MSADAPPPIRFDNRVVIVTGAGQGLGRAHALGFAARGAKVVVNDLGGSLDGAGGSTGAAETVAAEIRAAGGEAIADRGSVADPQAVEAMVARTLEAFGRVDVMVANAGILRDKSFAKLEQADWDAVIDVHLTGAFLCARAVWPHMRAQNYGRIVLTTSPSGLFGNFGQANYSAAKMGVVGLVNTLRLEGAKYGIHVNGLAPNAYTRMTAALFPPGAEAVFAPEAVTPGVLYLASEAAPNGVVLAGGGGAFATVKVMEGPGVALGRKATPEDVAGAFSAIADMTGADTPNDALAESMKIFARAATKA